MTLGYQNEKSDAPHQRVRINQNYCLVHEPWIRWRELFMDNLNNLGFNNLRFILNPKFDLKIRSMDNRWIIESCIDLKFNLILL